MADSNSRKDGSGANAARFFGVGFTFVFVICVFAAGGYLLDRFLGTIPVFLMAGLLLGMVGALYYLFRVLRKIGSS